MLNKDKYKTLSIGLDKETYEKLDEYCRDRTSKSIFIRGLVKRVLARAYGEKIEPDKNKTKVIKVRVDNYNEIEEYARVKKLGSVKALMTYTLGQHMTRYPLNRSEKTEKV